MTEEEVLFDDVYDLCEEIGRCVFSRILFKIELILHLAR